MSWGDKDDEDEDGINRKSEIWSKPSTRPSKCPLSYFDYDDDDDYEEEEKNEEENEDADDDDDDEYEDDDDDDEYEDNKRRKSNVKWSMTLPSICPFSHFSDSGKLRDSIKQRIFIKDFTEKWKGAMNLK